MLKIEREYNRFKVTFVGQRFTIKVTESQLQNVVAHYYVLDSHVISTCPVCQKNGNK